MRILVIGILIAGASPMIGAPGQTTPYPGQMTPARVWIQNRADAEAVPVSLRDASRDLAPLRVQVMNGEPQHPSNPVLVRLAARTWEYKTIAVGTGVDQAAALNKEGVAGWETAGIMWSTADRMALLLKRPRP